MTQRDVVSEIAKLAQSDPDNREWNEFRAKIHEVEFGVDFLQRLARSFEKTQEYFELYKHVLSEDYVKCVEAITKRVDKKRLPPGTPVGRDALEKNVMPFYIATNDARSEIADRSYAELELIGNKLKKLMGV